MNCPYCEVRMRCKDTTQMDGGRRWRLYVCPECGYRVETIEKVVLEETADERAKRGKFGEKRRESKDGRLLR